MGPIFTAVASTVVLRSKTAPAVNNATSPAHRAVCLTPGPPGPAMPGDAADPFQLTFKRACQGHWDTHGCTTWFGNGLR